MLLADHHRLDLSFGEYIVACGGDGDIGTGLYGPGDDAGGGGANPSEEGGD